MRSEMSGKSPEEFRQKLSYSTYRYFYPEVLARDILIAHAKENFIKRV
ncbi:hypothetical protein JYG23_13870 [Sedimentibacter sp. zth1]|nr:hypothetical protein [Sedimentibacter sp. zth1]QSX05734.1 hypothetical protein JYG23_13870 [Sedimentibacter sp. zth1]